MLLIRDLREVLFYIARDLSAKRIAFTDGKSLPQNGANERDRLIGGKGPERSTFDLLEL